MQPFRLRSHLARPTISRGGRALIALALAVGALLPSAIAANAADLTMTATPMLGGNVRPGSWAGFRVHLENSGPAIRGELRIRGGAQGASTYGTPIELATGAKQDQLLYAQPQWFGAKLSLDLVGEDGKVIATQDLKVTILDAYTPTVVVVAEKPEGIVRDLRSAINNPQMGINPAVLTVKPEDLPPRVEAWSAIDRLVWQDADSSRLSTEQINALETWVSAGGRFAIVGGTTGATGLSAFPAELLPFVPRHTADAGPTDLAALLGTLPAGAKTAPVLAGTLDHGTVLGRTGQEVFAAQANYGRGLVSIVGINPATSWLAGTDQVEGLWKRLVPTMQNGISVNPLNIGDDSLLVTILNNLPSVALPDIGILFVLLLGYIAVVGPLNYVILRRLDKREWAWVTMPVLVLAFAVAAYGLGLKLKGTDVIVNEIGVVRGATGTDRGVGTFYVGVFAPSRHTFDVRVSNAALLSNPAYLQQQGQTGVPLDVVQGDPSHLRGYEVGFGVLRSFRADASVTAPKLDSDFAFTGGRLKGTLTNRAATAVEDVAVVFAGNVAIVGTLQPGASANIDLDASTRSLASQGTPLSQRIFGSNVITNGSEGARSQATRRSVIDQITQYSDTIGGNGALQSGVMVLAWQKGGTLPVDVDTAAEQVGDTLSLLAATVKLEGEQVFTTPLFEHNQLAASSLDATDQGNGNFSLGRGTMVIEFRPMGLSQPFQASALRVAMSQGEAMNIGNQGIVLKPLPASQQPAQDDPLGERAPLPTPLPAAVTPSPAPDQGNGGRNGTGTGDTGGNDPGAPVDLPGKPGVFDGLPDFQLLDRTTNLWVEFPHMTSANTYQIENAERYVDATGAFVARFVNRAEDGNSVYFNLLERLEGSIQ